MINTYVCPPVNNYSELIDPPEGENQAISFDLSSDVGTPKSFVFKNGEWSKESIDLTVNNTNSDGCETEEHF